MNQCSDIANTETTRFKCMMEVSDFNENCSFFRTISEVV